MEGPLGIMYTLLGISAMFLPTSNAAPTEIICLMWTQTALISLGQNCSDSDELKILQMYVWNALEQFFPKASSLCWGQDCAPCAIAQTSHTLLRCFFPGPVCFLSLQYLKMCLSLSLWARAQILLQEQYVQLCLCFPWGSKLSHVNCKRRGLRAAAHS